MKVGINNNADVSVGAAAGAATVTTAFACPWRRDSAPHSTLTLPKCMLHYRPVYNHVLKKRRVHGQFLCAKNNLMCLAYSYSHKFVRPHVCINYWMLALTAHRSFQNARFIIDLFAVTCYLKQATRSWRVPLCNQSTVLYLVTNARMHEFIRPIHQC